MKKLLLILALLLVAMLCIGQTNTNTKVIDTLTEDTLTITQKVYQYRLSFDSIKTINWSNEIKPQLNDIFKTDPIFCEEVGQYVFTSNTDVGMSDVIKTFQSTGHKLTYFRKDTLISQ